MMLKWLIVKRAMPLFLLVEGNIIAGIRGYCFSIGILRYIINFCYVRISTLKNYLFLVLHMGLLGIFDNVIR